MDYSKLLARGVGAWLGFESACNRTGLFSEKYLAHAIGQILNSRNEGRVIAEYSHPVLSEHKTWAGRRPAVDFAVLDTMNTVSMVVESKWVGRTVPSIESIAWDLIRLALMSQTGAKCFFVMAGQKAKIDKLFQDDEMRGTAVSPRKPLLRHDTISRVETELVPNHRVRIEMMRRIFANYPALNVPQSIVTQGRHPFPSDAKPRQYLVYVWDVAAHPSGRTFKPGNSREYRVTGLEI